MAHGVYYTISLTFNPQLTMLFLRNKKQNRWMQVVWSVIGLLVIVSMVLLYMPAFL